MRILIADDDPDFCLLIRTILGNAGHTTFTARDALETVSLAQRQRPDLILLDIRMPAGTGMGALARLKSSAHTADIPVVVLSGVTDEGVEAAARRDGAVDFLRKPVDDGALLSAVEQWAARPHPAA